MKLKKAISLGIGILGAVFIFMFLMDSPTITGRVIGANSNSRYLAIIGIFLMVIAIIIEKYELELKK